MSNFNIQGLPEICSIAGAHGSSEERMPFRNIAPSGRSGTDRGEMRYPGTGVGEECPLSACRHEQDPSVALQAPQPWRKSPFSTGGSSNRNAVPEKVASRALDGQRLPPTSFCERLHGRYKASQQVAEPIGGARASLSILVGRSHSGPTQATKAISGTSFEPGVSTGPPWTIQLPPPPAMDNHNEPRNR